MENPEHPAGEEQPLEILLEVGVVRNAADRPEGNPLIKIDRDLAQQCPSWMQPIIEDLGQINANLVSHPSTGEYPGWQALQRILHAVSETNRHLQIILQPPNSGCIARIVLRAGKVLQNGENHPVGLQLEHPFVEGEVPSCLERFRKRIDALNDTLWIPDIDREDAARQWQEFSTLIRYLRRQKGCVYLKSIPADGG